MTANEFNSHACRPAGTAGRAVALLAAVVLAAACSGDGSQALPASGQPSAPLTATPEASALEPDEPQVAVDGTLAVELPIGTVAFDRPVSVTAIEERSAGATSISLEFDQLAEAPELLVMAPVATGDGTAVADVATLLSQAEAIGAGDVEATSIELVGQDVPGRVGLTTSLGSLRVANGSGASTMVIPPQFTLDFAVDTPAGLLVVTAGGNGPAGQAEAERVLRAIAPSIRFDPSEGDEAR
jgi:hypothetical protein